MSLVSTYVRAVDGKLYRNPVFRGENWFIVFDDDDPPELVFEPKGGIELVRYRATIILNDRGIKYKLMGEPCSSGLRCFSSIGDMRKAYRVFFELLSRIPVPQEHDGAIDSEKEVIQGVFYDFPAN